MGTKRYVQFAKFVKLKKISQTCFACPTQYEGKTEDGEYFYCRHRYGYMSIELNGHEIVSTTYGDSYSGCCSWDDFVTQAALNGVIIDASNAEWLDDEEGVWND